VAFGEQTLISIIKTHCRLYRWFEKWADKPVHERGDDYDALKDKLSKQLLDILYEFVPQIKDKIEFYHLATPLTEESYLKSFKGGAYDTLCTPDMFAPVNQKWITTPHTQIPRLHLAGSSAFFPGLTGAMYGGALCACSVLGYLGTARLGYDLLSNLAMRLREENPKLSWFQAYREGFHKFVNE
jgi:phytoene dehydrogenase-like protein